MMQLIQKISTAMRGGTREVLESVVDANALTILSQEIYECEASMRQSKQHLANVIAEKISLKRKLEAQKANLKSKEEAIKVKLRQGDEVGAMHLAEAVAAQEALLEKQQGNYNQLAGYETDLLRVLKNTAYTLGEYRTELNMAKATLEAQKTMGKLSMHENTHSDSFAKVQDSLDRIRRRKETFDDQMQAMQDIDAHIKGEPTPQQYRSSRAEEILNGLRAKD
jgi:phage shock protein A